MYEELVDLYNLTGKCTEYYGYEKRFSRISN